MTHLHTLRLALELKEDDFRDPMFYPEEIGVRRRIGSIQQSAWRWAYTVSEELVAVRRFSLEARPHSARSKKGVRFIEGDARWLGFRIDERSGVVEREMSSGWEKFGSDLIPVDDNLRGGKT